MDTLLIEGPVKLSGVVRISCAKNAYLPIMTALLLNKFPVTLKELPKLKDISTLKSLLIKLGVKVTEDKDAATFDASSLVSREATYELVKTMRASILVLGPLLARERFAKVSLPGGCAIGTRPIDIHLDGMKKMGAEITIEHGYVEAKCPNGLIGADIVLSFPSVGATENIMMAATLAKGITKIENAALEPEIVDLADFLNAMGAKVSGAGTSIVTIEGVKELHSAAYLAIGDRIEAATYLIAALATNSEITIENINPSFLDAVISTLKASGAVIETTKNSIKVFKSKLKGFKVDTAPHPGFPTDVQAQIMALATIVDGASIVTENIFENRFMHVPELIRMGAKITLKGNTAVVEGVKELSGAPVMCTDLRASAALIVAALAAKGTSEINRVYHLDRGYDNLDGKLTQLGVKIRRVSK